MAALLLSASASAVIQEPGTPIQHLPWPEVFAGEFVKLDSACLFEPGVPQLLVLAGDELILVRDPMIVVLPEMCAISRDEKGVEKPPPPKPPPGGDGR